MLELEIKLQRKVGGSRREAAEGLDTILKISSIWWAVEFIEVSSEVM
jgi:hypothetical protein